jgi:hypothetical protein
VEADQCTLESMARNNLKLLDELEKEFFGFTIRDGVKIPNHPEYWSVKECEPQVL